MKTVLLVLAALAVFAPNPARAEQPVTLDELSKLVEGAWSSWQGVRDYTAIFMKQELVKGDLLDKETIQVKFRKEPHSVYMHWVADPHEGRETLFVKGKNDNEIKAHEGGLLGAVNVNLDPRGDMAMKENRHTVWEAGLGATIQLIKDDLALAREKGDGTFVDLGMKAYEGMSVRCFRATFPEASVKPISTYNPVNGKHYSADITICIDGRTNMPVVVENRSAKGKLVEYYVHKNLKLNAGLTDKDFDPDNDNYRF
jgi:hypothetical protein